MQPDVRPTPASRLSDERGFTLVELLVAMTIGLLIVSAALTAMIASGRQSNRVHQRVVRTQDARAGMERVVQRLKSVACSDGELPILAASGSSITFLADLDGDLTLDPLEYQVASEDVPGRASLARLVITQGTGPRAVTAVLADDALERASQVPLLQYRIAGRGPYVTGPLDPAQLAQVSEIQIAMRIYDPPPNASIGRPAGAQFTAITNTVVASRSSGQQVDSTTAPVFTCAA